MAGRGWKGSPPGTEEEARRRILEAADRCLERYGPAKTGLSDVAAELGVTRQTVYRYFPSTTELLLASAVEATGPFVERLAEHCAALEDPGEIAVAAIVYVLEHLPQDPRLSLLLAPDRRDLLVAGIISPEALGFAEALLRRFPVDWRSLGYDDAELTDLAEHLLRVMQSFVIAPGDPPRSSEHLTRYLTRWVAPAIRHRP